MHLDLNLRTAPRVCKWSRGKAWPLTRRLAPFCVSSQKSGTWEMMNISCAPWQPTVTQCKSPRKMALPYHWMESTQSVQTICNEEISSQLGTRLKDSDWSSHCSNTFNQTPPPLMMLNIFCWNPCFTRTANFLWNNCWTMTVDEHPPPKKTLSTSLKRNPIKF